jgi:hypothetical protein
MQATTFKGADMRLMDYLKRPLVAGALAGVIGLVVGLFFAWMVWPAEFTDADPTYLNQHFQEEYLRMAIDSYGVNHNPDLAVQRWRALGPNAAPLFEAITKPPLQQDLGAIMGFRAAIEGAGIQIGAPTSTPTPTPETSTGFPLGKYALWGGIAVIALVIAALAVYFGRRLLFVKQVAPEDYSPARQAQEFTRSVEKTDFSRKGIEKPITQTMTTYVLGDDLYDESFSIDSPAGEFLGEYGVGVSETMGVGEPKKVTAIEIWLFDKNDIKTATKVLMSQHAFGDAAIRGRLEAKGELVSVQPQSQIVLETATLQLLATVVDMEYGHGNMPDNSFFERITLELAIWPKG